MRTSVDPEDLHGIERQRATNICTHSNMMLSRLAYAHQVFHCDKPGHGVVAPVAIAATNPKLTRDLLLIVFEPPLFDGDQPELVVRATGQLDRQVGHRRTQVGIRQRVVRLTNFTHGDLQFAKVRSKQFDASYVEYNFLCFCQCS